MATYYNPGSITYDSGTNTITVLGGYHTGTILYASDNSTTDFNGKDAFTGTNTPDEVIGRFMWFYDKSIVDNGYADVNDWSNHWAEDYDIEPYVRRITSGGWEDWGCHPDYPWGFIPSEVSGDLDNYMVSWNFEDIYQADQTNGWGVITKHDTDNYTIDCNLTIGDHDLQTPTFLAQFQGTLNFGIDGNNSLKIYRYGFFQFGQMYGGTPMGGGIMTAYWGSVTDVEGAGIYRVFNTYCQFQMRDQFGFTHYNYRSYNPYFEYNNVSHNAWQSTKGGKYYIASGNPIWTNVKFSHTSADAYRGWNTTIRTSPYLNNVEYSFKASMQYQILGGDVKIIRDLVKGGGSVSFGAISYYGSGDAYVRLINPTNIDITTDFGLAAHSSNLYLLHLQEAQYYNAKLIDSNGILESGVIDITNVNKENLFTATTDVNGQIPQQEIVSREFVTYTSESEATLNSFAPFSIKYFKYGYLPLELSNSFEGAVNESMLLLPDTNTNLDYSTALSVPDVRLHLSGTALGADPVDETNMSARYLLSSSVDDLQDSFEPTSTTNITYESDASRGNVARFDGTAYADIPNPIAGATAFTVSCWLKLDSLTSDMAILGEYSPQTLILFHDASPQGMKIYVGNGSATVLSWNTNFLPEADTWYHFTFSWQSGGTAYIYVNGVEQDSNSAGTGAVGTAPLRIGDESGTKRLQGYMSDLRIFTEQLDATAIANLYLDSQASVDGTYYDTNGNFYSYNIDCGGNALGDVYDNINARLATKDAADTLASSIRLVTTHPLTYDGTVFNGSQRFYFTNYAGNIAKQIADDGTVFTPPTSVIYKLTGLQTGTEVRIYQTSDMTELAGIESSTTSFQYSYIYAADIEVVVVIFAIGYQPIRIETTLTNENASIPIQQVIDRNYKNPV